MRFRSVRVLTVVLASVLALAMLAGCGGDIAKANEAMEAANAQVAEFNKIDTEVGGIMDEIDALGDSEEDLAKGVTLVDTALAGLADRGENIEAVKAEMSKIAAMDLSDEMKEYAAQQIEIWELQADVDGKTTGLLEKLKELYSGRAAGTLDDAAATALSEEMQALAQEVDTLQSELTEKQEASKQYYEENELGN